MIHECSEVSERGLGKMKFVEQSYSHFFKLPLENQAIASAFVLKYGQGRLCDSLANSLGRRADN